MRLGTARGLQRSVGGYRQAQAVAGRYERGDFEPRRARAEDHLATRRSARTIAAERARARGRHDAERTAARVRRVGETLPDRALLRAELSRGAGGRARRV